MGLAVFLLGCLWCILWCIGTYLERRKQEDDRPLDPIRQTIERKEQEPHPYYPEELVMTTPHHKGEIRSYIEGGNGYYRFMIHKFPDTINEGEREWLTKVLNERYDELHKAYIKEMKAGAKLVLETVKENNEK